MPETTWRADDSIRILLRQMLHETGRNPATRIEVEDVEIAVELVGLGLADSVIPRGAAEQLLPRLAPNAGWVSLRPKLYDMLRDRAPRRRHPVPGRAADDRAGHQADPGHRPAALDAHVGTSVGPHVAPTPRSVVREFFRLLAAARTRRRRSSCSTREVGLAQHRAADDQGPPGRRRCCSTPRSAALTVDITIHHAAADGDVVLTDRTDVLRNGRSGRRRSGSAAPSRSQDGRIVLWDDAFSWVDFAARLGLVRA